MKRVNFNSLKVKNFLSIGEDELDLGFEYCVSLITGENKDSGGRNGVGKSSLIESIYWCLFGNTMRPIKKDKVIHNHQKDTCCVILNFDVEDNGVSDSYQLTRKLEPSKLTLYKNKEDITLSTMPRTDELVINLIGATEEVFQNAVIMSANNTKPFMAQDKIDKRKFVEGILNLGIFGEMLLKTRSDYNEKKKQNDIIGSSFQEKQRTLRNYDTQIQINKDSKSKKIESILLRIENNEKQAKEISEDTSIGDKLEKIKQDIIINEQTITKIEEGVIKIREKIDKESPALGEINFKITGLEKELSNFKSSDAKCPTCKRKYDVTDPSHVCIDIDSIKSEILSENNNKQIIRKKLEELASKQNLLGSEMSFARKRIRNLNEDQLKYSSIHQDIENILKRNKELKEELEELEETKDGLLELKESLDNEITEIEKQIQELQKKLLVLETAKFVVSEEGVKTFIVKKMLTVLNAQLNFYLKTLDAPCTCKFDEFFKETIYNSQGNECSYFNFSGGERKRIDIAILFMFQDILRMQTGVSFNLSMYDELFDSALDEKGINKILEMLKERSEKFKECIYIISHSKAACNTTFDKVILLQKIDGKTSIVP